MHYTGILFGLTMFMVSIALVMAVIVTNLFLRKDSGRRVPFYVRRVFLRGGRITAPPPTTTMKASRRKSGAPVNNDCRTSAANNRLGRRATTAAAAVEAAEKMGMTNSRGTTEEELYDLDSLSILSELDALQAAAAMGSSFRSRGSGGSTGRRQTGVATLAVPRPALSGNRRTSKRSHLSVSGPDGYDENIDVDDDEGEDALAAAHDRQLIQRRSHEWQRLAKVVDRVFFWLFLISSVTTLTVMFQSIPP